MRHYERSQTQISAAFESSLCPIYHGCRSDASAICPPVSTRCYRSGASMIARSAFFGFSTIRNFCFQTSYRQADTFCFEKSAFNRRLLSHRNASAEFSLTIVCPLFRHADASVSGASSPHLSWTCMSVQDSAEADRPDHLWMSVLFCSLPKLQDVSPPSVQCLPPVRILLGGATAESVRAAACSKCFDLFRRSTISRPSVPASRFCRL